MTVGSFTIQYNTILCNAHTKRCSRQPADRTSTASLTPHSRRLSLPPLGHWTPHTSRSEVTYRQRLTRPLDTAARAQPAYTAHRHAHTNTAPARSRRHASQTPCRLNGCDTSATRGQLQAGITRSPAFDSVQGPTQRSASGLSPARVRMRAARAQPSLCYRGAREPWEYPP